MSFDRQAAVKQLELILASLKNLKDSCNCERSVLCSIDDDNAQCTACDLAWAIETELFEINEVLEAVKREELIYA